MAITQYPWWGPQLDPPLADSCYFSLKDFGAKGDGITDDTQAFLQAVNVLSTYNTKSHPTTLPGNPGDVRNILLGECGRKYKLTQTFSVNYDLFGFWGNGCCIDASSMTSGNAINVYGNNVNAGAACVPMFGGFNLLGPGINSSVTGILVGNSNIFGSPSLEIRHVAVQNFGNGISCDEQGIWLLRLDHVVVEFCNNGFLYYPIESTGGENFLLLDTTLSGCNIGIKYWNVFGDFTMIGGSIDYCVCGVLQLNGNMTFRDVHVESSHYNTAIGYPIQGGGGNSGSQKWYGGSHYWTGVGSGQWIENTGVTSAYYMLFDGVTFDAMNSLSMRLVGPGTGNTYFRNTIDKVNANSPLLQTNLNFVSDSTFANSGAASVLQDPWLITGDSATITDLYTGTNIAISVATNDPDNPDTYNLKAIKTSGNTAAAFGLLIPISQPNTVCGIRFDYAVTSTGQCSNSAIVWKAAQVTGWVTGTAGTAHTAIPIYGKTSTLQTTALTAPTTAFQQGIDRLGSFANVPCWATHILATIDLNNTGTSTAGTFNLDNIEFYKM